MSRRRWRLLREGLFAREGAYWQAAAGSSGLPACMHRPAGLQSRRFSALFREGQGVRHSICSHKCREAPRTFRAHATLEGSDTFTMRLLPIRSSTVEEPSPPQSHAARSRCSGALRIDQRSSRILHVVACYGDDALGLARLSSSPQPSSSSPQPSSSHPSASCPQPSIDPSAGTDPISTPLQASSSACTCRELRAAPAPLAPPPQPPTLPARSTPTPVGRGAGDDLPRAAAKPALPASRLPLRLANTLPPEGEERLSGGESPNSEPWSLSAPSRRRSCSSSACASRRWLKLA